MSLIQPRTSRDYALADELVRAHWLVAGLSTAITGESYPVIL